MRAAAVLGLLVLLTGCAATTATEPAEAPQAPPATSVATKRCPATCLGELLERRKPGAGVNVRCKATSLSDWVCTSVVLTRDRIVCSSHVVRVPSEGELQLLRTDAGDCPLDEMRPGPGMKSQ